MKQQEQAKQALQPRQSSQQKDTMPTPLGNQLTKVGKGTKKRQQTNLWKRHLRMPYFSTNLILYLDFRTLLKYEAFSLTTYLIFWSINLLSIFSLPKFKLFLSFHSKYIVAPRLSFLIIFLKFLAFQIVALSIIKSFQARVLHLQLQRVAHDFNMAWLKSYAK